MKTDIGATKKDCLEYTDKTKKNIDGYICRSFSYLINKKRPVKAKSSAIKSDMAKTLKTYTEGVNKKITEETILIRFLLVLSLVMRKRITAVNRVAATEMARPIEKDTPNNFMRIAHIK